MTYIIKNRVYSISRNGLIFFGLFLFLVGLTGGYFFWRNSGISDVSQKRADDPNLTFTNPLLACGVYENTEFGEYKTLEQMINDKIKKIDPENKSAVSVYYRDFNSGRWFGINESYTYSPASLLKVPIMIAYLREAESNPNILSRKIYYDGNTVVSNSVEFYKSKNYIKAGNYYTVDQLISSMIEYSDNAATVLLFQNIDNNSLVEVMTDIGFKLPKGDGANQGTDDYMTVKTYSFLFRLLYNSTYLNRDMSEKALKILSNADFNNGITNGLPSDIKISHKFGERTILDNTGNYTGRELHDCGVVYNSKHPYLLCVMTKGKDFETLSSIISAVSTTVYSAVK